MKSIGQGIIEAKDLTREIGGRTIVHSLSATFATGAVHVIVGPNGAGKTTALRMLAGLEPPTRGVLTVGGKPLGRLSADERARLIALHLEVPDAAFAYTAAEIVAMGRYPYQLDRVARARDPEAIATALALFDLGQLASRPYPVLSAGEKQRVGLARAFAQDAPIALLDEPLARLDPYHVERVIVALRAAAVAGRTIVAIVHDLDVAARVADVVHVMRDGTLDVSGPPDEVLTVARIAAVWGIDVDFVDAPGTDGRRRRVIAVRGAALSR